VSILLAVLAAVLHGTAYTIYLTQVYFGESVPNPASWSVWAFLSVLNAFSFARASGNWLKALQFFTGAVMCLVVFAYSLWAGHFAPLTGLGYTVLVLSLIACLIWCMTRASYASVAIAAIFLISSVPTVMGVWQNTNTEHQLPWWLWTTAFCLTFANVLRDWGQIRKREPHPWTVTAVPVSGIILHCVVALLAK
jgi:hypothetical protein